MRRLAFLFFIVASPALAQFTVVSGTITDANGLPYSGGRMSVTLTLPTGAIGAYLNGSQISGSLGPVTLDNTGSFILRAGDNTLIQCANAQGQIVACAPQTQWTFSVTESPGIPPPVGTGPQTCAATLTISGSSQIVGSSFSCPALTLLGNGTGPNTYNVKTNGAKGDTQIATAACTTNLGSPNISCTGVTFKTTDVFKRMNCGQSLGGGLFFPIGTTIASFTSSSSLVLSGNAAGNATTATCSWGTVDDVAINTTVTAWLAAIRAGTGQGPKFQGPIPQNPPTLYYPTGGYLYCGSGGNPMINTPSTAGGALIIGDAPHESWIVGCDNPTAVPGNLGFFINQQSGGNALVIKNLAFTNAIFGGYGASIAVLLAGIHHTEDLYFTYWNASAPFISQGSGWNLNLVVDSSGGSFQGGSLVCNACSDEFHYGGSSNNAGSANTAVTTAVGLNTGLGPRFYNYLNDEGACAISCFNVTNTSDLWIFGSALFGVGTSALRVDGNSFVHVNGGIVGVFGNDNNSNGLVVATGGQIQSSDVRYVGTGTGKCIQNSGSFYDNGGNSCETQFPVSTSSSAGTAATLTVTTVGANVNTLCTVGDSLVVQGNNVAGYNGYFPFGITSVGVNTIGYTTQGANIGAGGGGTAYCRNLQTYTGNLPKPLLNNPVPNTCVITGTFAATVTGAPMCNFKLQSATNISFISASSTTVTACTVAPVVTISDGTVSQTLTITTAKSQWASNVDASTGVGTSIFKPNGTIQVTNTAGTCTTPPTNFAVSYNVAPILSN